MTLAAVEEVRLVLDLHRNDRDSLFCEQSPAFGRLVRQDAVGRPRVYVLKRLMQAKSRGAHRTPRHRQKPIQYAS